MLYYDEIAIKTQSSRTVFDNGNLGCLKELDLRILVIFKYIYFEGYLVIK